MAVNIKKEIVKGVVTKTHADGSIETDETHEEEVGAVNVPDNAARVTVEAGITRNLGNYESIRYHVSLTLPCLPEAEDIDETYNSAKEWVDDKLSSINEEVSGMVS